VNEPCPCLSLSCCSCWCLSSSSCLCSSCVVRLSVSCLAASSCSSSNSRSAFRRCSSSSLCLSRLYRQQQTTQRYHSSVDRHTNVLFTRWMLSSITLSGVFRGSSRRWPPRVSHPNFLRKNLHAQCMDIWCEVSTLEYAVVHDDLTACSRRDKRVLSCLDPVSNLQLFSLNLYKLIEAYWKFGNWKLGRDKTKLSCLVSHCVHSADTDKTTRQDSLVAVCHTN